MENYNHMSINLNKLFTKILSDRLGRSATRLELAPRLRAVGERMPSLTESEKHGIQKIWEPIGSGIINLDYWRFYKYYNGEKVSPLYVPDNIYWSRIIRALNPISLTRTYINKSLYPITLRGGVKQPEVLANVINGVIYDSEMNRMSFNQAAEKIFIYERDVIIKPTVASSGGHGVIKLPAKTSLEEIKETLLSYGLNYICQGVVGQSKYTAVFNKSSLNTFRVNTVNINGNTTCECLMFRHGLNGNVVDNFAAGGVVCGMSKNGQFNGTNFNTKLQTLTNHPDGCPYTSFKIPHISDIIDAAVNAHQRFMPHIGHAAWDFAIDENECPVMIEVNLMLPGIIMEQLTSGNSIFGDRTEEVINYALKRNNNIRWTEFVGGWQ